MSVPALAHNDLLSGLGNTKGQMVQVNLNASTNLHSVDEFQKLMVKQADGAIVQARGCGKRHPGRG